MPLRGPVIGRGPVSGKCQLWKLVLFPVARTHWITARVIGEKKFLIETLDSEISVLIMQTS